MKKVLAFTLLIICCQIGIGQQITPRELIEKSINYHDPDGTLFTKDIHMELIGSSPNRDDRKTSIAFNIKKEKFQMSNVRDGKSIVRSSNKGLVKISIDGEFEFSKETADKYRLSTDRVVMMKNYYQYLWLMPMKLNDSGTILDPTVKTTDFFGKESLTIKVTYREEVGEDVWYFYFDPISYAMQGYRFYHDEAKNDGEYIILEEEVVFGSVKLPKKRTWYTHTEDKLLGTDILSALEF